MSSNGLPENNSSLGWRRNVLLDKASHSPDISRVFHHSRTLESFCGRNKIRLSVTNGLVEELKSVPAPTIPSQHLFHHPYSLAVFLLALFYIVLILGRKGLAELIWYRCLCKNWF